MKFKLVEEYITESYSVMSGHVLELVESCAENLKTLGYTINNDIEYRWTAATTYFGCIEPKNGRFIFALSVGIKDATDDDLKCTIYHEFAHYIANNNLIATGEYFWKNGKLCRNRRCSETSHGPMWRRIASDISRKTGVTITVSGGKCKILASDKKWIMANIFDNNTLYNTPGDELDLGPTELEKLKTEYGLIIAI